MWVPGTHTFSLSAFSSPRSVAVAKGLQADVSAPVGFADGPLARYPLTLQAPVA